jgi:hypothetical protein
VISSTSRTTPEALSASYVTEFLTTSEGLDLVKAFTRIEDPKVRRAPKDLGDVLQAAGADAVGSLLVLLAHVEHEPARAHAAADVLVYRIENASGHLYFLVVAAISGYPGRVLQAPVMV